jgi:hypothetical protein
MQRAQQAMITIPARQSTTPAPRPSVSRQHTQAQAATSYKALTLAEQLPLRCRNAARAALLR